MELQELTVKNRGLRKQLHAELWALHRYMQGEEFAELNRGLQAMLEGQSECMAATISMLDGGIELAGDLLAALEFSAPRGPQGGEVVQPSLLGVQG